MLTPDKLHDYQKKAVIHQCTHPNSMLWLDVGLGKQQPNSEPVLTPDGWVPMGDLRPGDYVIGSNGTPTEVLATFPQGEHETVKVTFTDGSWCHVGWEHLWYVQNPNQKLRDKVGHVMTTRQLVDSGLTRPSGTRGEDTYWYIPMTQPVQFSEKVFPIDPYTMGVMMGDGTFTASGYVTICTDDEIIRNTGANFVKGHETCNYVAYGSYKGMSEVVRNLGLAGKRSWEKHIPQEYMVGSVDQRLALLQGLLDTDGSPIDKGGVEFSSTSEALTDAVVELAQSLGGTARKTGPRITQHRNGDGRPSWRVNVKLPPHFDPFRLQRKLDKWVRPTKYLPIRKMVSAEVVGKEQATCIKVAASDSLYVTRNYVVTHNTVITLTSIAHLINTNFLRGVIIVAPIRVIRLVWRQEAQKWSHTKGLTFSMVTGTKDQRTRALMRPANVYLINYDNLRWLGETLQTYFISKGRPIPFNGIVWDECFPSDVRVSTPNSDVSISNIKIGDIVNTHLGPRRVINTMTKKVYGLVTITLTNGTVIKCTPNHPFMANGNWCVAGELTEGDVLHERAQHSPVWSERLSDMRSSVLEKTRNAVHMLQRVCKRVENAATGNQKSYHLGWDKSVGEASSREWNMEQGKTLVYGDAIKNERVSQRKRLFSFNWWEWCRGGRGQKIFSGAYYRKGLFRSTSSIFRKR